MSLQDKPEALREKVSFLPDTPGVYTYYDAKGTVIYVGKAKNLRRRVSSYFNREHPVLRTNLLVRAIADMSYIVVPTENDALNLENALIKEHRPRYNVLLKDDKSYPWIAVTNEMYPRVFITHHYLRDGSKYFGPYTNQSVAKTIIELIRQIYPLRTCRLPITPEYLRRGAGHLCLQYHIKRCQGCCAGLVDAETYQSYIAHIKKILAGDTAEILDYLRTEMARLAADLKFEEAQALKERYQLLEKYHARSVIISQTTGDVDVFGLDAPDDDADAYVNYMHVRAGTVVRSVTLHYRRNMDEPAGQILDYAMAEIAQQFALQYRRVVTAVTPETDMPDVEFITPQRGDKMRLLEVSQRNARQRRLDDLKHIAKHNPEQRVRKTLEQIQKDFRLSELPTHIECFDNSNIQGTNPVASCVVFRNAKPSKKDYRHFNIKTVVGPDDFASMREVLTRRYTRLMEEGQELPQLIVVDGGKGQLSAAVEALDAIGLRGKIAVVGIAKRLEEIFFPGDSVPIYIDKNSESLRVVQHLRDEAHRFGITHHRNRRSASAITSELDAIPGVGERTRTALLSHFRSAKRVKAATEAELAAVVGPARARAIAAHFAQPDHDS